MDSTIGSIHPEVTVSLTALAILNHFLRTLLIHVDHVKIRIYIICWCMADNRWLKEHSCGEPNRWPEKGSSFLSARCLASVTLGPVEEEYY